MNILDSAITECGHVGDICNLFAFGWSIGQSVGRRHFCSTATIDRYRSKPARSASSGSTMCRVAFLYNITNLRRSN